MFNLFPITTAKMTMTMNDVAVQSMLLLIDNILPDKTCLKLGGRILNKGAKKINCFNTWRTLLNFYIYIELNKDTIVRFPHGNDDM